LLLLPFILKFVYGQKIDCVANKYEHDQSFIGKLQGRLYTVRTSVHYADNEIFNFIWNSINEISTKTYNDAGCCKTMTMTTTPKKEKRGNKYGYLPYKISTAPSCPTQSSESAHWKIISCKTECDGSYCIMVHSCRESREGVHALCSSSQVTPTQHEWINDEYKKLNLTPVYVKQDTDYKQGACLSNCKQN